MILSRVETHKIKYSDKNYQFLYNYLIKANNLYNHANYVVRQRFIETTKLKEQGKLQNAEWIRYGELDKLLKADKDYPDYYDLPIAACSQQILRLVDKNWTSFFRSIKDWSKNKNKYSGRPKLPKYKKKEQPFMLIIPAPYFSIKNNRVQLTKAFNKISFNSKFQNRKDYKSIQQIRILSRNDYLKVEIIYNIEVDDKLNNNQNYLSIDIGIDNLATITTNNQDTPIIINGKPVKNINHYFNKQKAYFQSRLEKCQNKKTSKNLQKLSTKRENKINDYFHKASRFIIDYCKSKNIDNIIIGHSIFWKNKLNLGKRNNQTFTQIPFSKLFQMIQYKAEQENIKVIITEESYTSKASFFDNDEIPVWNKGQKVNTKFSGKRITRGLYKTKTGYFVNADVNGSLNILRKVVSDVEIPADIGFVNNPVKINLSKTKFSDLKNSLSNKTKKGLHL